ncbi:MAG: hypothetical protein AAGG02_13935 [Cyanobacteria bacterium P01_H01_bin.15]
MKSNYQNWSLSALIGGLFWWINRGVIFATPYTIQDDARQHVFWMQRFQDPGLFQNDRIADYFQSVAPWGYANFYKVFALLGVDPITFSQFVPLILGVAASVFCFGVCIEICPKPQAGLIAVLLLNQNLWMVDDLSSGTPRAFLYPLFLGFLWAWLRSCSIVSEGVSQTGLTYLMVILLGLFYPPGVLLATGILAIQGITQPSRRTWQTALGILLGVGILGIYATGAFEYGPLVSVDQARSQPEFLTGGRSEFFVNDTWQYWLFGRSGLLPADWPYLLIFSFGLFLPWLKQFKVFPLLQTIRPQWVILLDLLIVSLGLFVIAHVFLFRLHLPSRYMHHSLRIVFAIAGGIALAGLLDGLSRWLSQRVLGRQGFQNVLFVGLVALFLLPSVAVTAYPFRLAYFDGPSPELYAFLRTQPKDIVIGTISAEADFIPSFGRRSVLAAPEYGIPYHLGYYEPFRTGALALLQAQYSESTADLQGFLVQYPLTYWLLDRDAFEPGYLSESPWTRTFPVEIKQLDAQLPNTNPVLKTLRDRCTVFETEQVQLMDSQCLQTEITTSR